MASDYLLELDGIKGEAQDSKHKNSIEIDSFSGGVTHPGTAASGTGHASGKSSFQDFHFTMRNNTASPNVMLACATGKHIPKATLWVRKATGDGGQQEYLTITLTDVLVSSYQSGGHAGGDSIPMEQFSLNFAKVKVEYKPQNADGSLGSAITTEYDVKQAKKV